MADLVGGAFLSATLQVLFDRLASREVINFFRGKNHGDRVLLLLRKLKLSLLGLSAVLNDAEDKQITNPAVKEWVEELKDVVYHADDLVDEIATEALRSKLEADFQSCISISIDLSQVLSLNPLTLTPTTTASLFDAGIESRIEEIIDRLEYFAKEKDVLGLREVVGHNNLFHRSQTSSLVDESRVYGRDVDKEDIMKLLLPVDDEASGSSNEIDVIPIVGMGGVGKTTLAQLLYNDHRVCNHFEMKAWVCLSNEFDVLRVNQVILEAITQQTCDAKNLDMIQVKLKELVSGKKFLIVLDDVWNENYDHWDSLSCPFRYGARGSRIIVTTRNERVASVMQTVPIHRLQELPFEDCWKLFAKHAFEKGDFNSHPKLENIGKEIVKKCKGLPSTTKTLAGLLRSKRDAEDWSNILKSAIWDLPKDNILLSLRLSYHYLLSHLKRCFAYCSIFPKGYEFKMEELVLLWIAEGFLKPRSNTTMEEVGYECFNELLSMSLFQQSARESCFVMHDLINDLAQSVSGDFCSRLDDDKPHIIVEKVRHFSYARGIFDDFQRFQAINEAKFLRTFLPIRRRHFYNCWLTKMVLDVILSRLICLRVLSLPYYEIFELPHSIGNMIHLCYLDLSCTKIRQLPESICNLYNLQTLLLRNCYNLATLPTEIGKLILLRHLDISGTYKLREMPMKMSRLKDLQTLTAFVVGNCSGSRINELKEFRLLRGRLSISRLQNIASCTDAMEAKLKEKNLLETLVLRWDSGITNDSQSERAVLDKLQPHTNLKHLEINRYRGTRFPEWLGDQSFCNMVSLRLKDCEHCVLLPSLGQLPSLKHLTISGMHSLRKVDPKFYGDCSLSKPFQSLETLIFSEMLDWEEWHILDDGEFSHLQELRVINCPKLIGGLPKHIPSCVRVEIRDCPGLTASLPMSCVANRLVLRGCDGVELGWQGLSSLVELVISSTSLNELTPELCTLTNLKDLRIEGCPDLSSFPDTRLPSMLTRLTIISCKAIRCLPERVMCLSNCLQRLEVKDCPKLVFPQFEELEKCYSSLEYLSLENCDSLSSLPLGLFPKLRTLNIKDVRKFSTLSTLNRLGFQNFASLEWLSLAGCSNMESFSQQVLIAPNLKTFQLWNCEKLKSLPDQMINLTSLQSLSIYNCPGIESFSEGGLPSSLHGLEIWECAKLVGRRKEWDLQRLPYLTHFIISGEYEEDVLESFPEEGLLPSTLISLCIQSLPNLKSLNNKGLEHLGSLKNMRIAGCPQLQSLPEEGLPTSLLLLEISECLLLKPRCLRDQGQDWHKIARIPLLHTDSELSFDQRTVGPTQPYSLFSEGIWLVAQKTVALMALISTSEK